MSCVKITNIDIPERVLEHRFYRELSLELSSDSMSMKNTEDRVLGTHNNNSPELYGFVGDIESHVDNKGIVYFMPLNDVTGIVFSENESSINYNQGDIIRIDDRISHGVYQEGYVLAMFIGAFDYPQDAEVIKRFKMAVSCLSEKNNYKTAPRWLSAPLADDECFILEGVEAVRELLSETKEPILCSADGCQNIATTLDPTFPYFWEYNTCNTHKS